MQRVMARDKIIAFYERAWLCFSGKKCASGSLCEPNDSRLRKAVNVFSREK